MPTIRLSLGKWGIESKMTASRLLRPVNEEWISTAKIDLTLRADQLENTDIVRSVRMPNLSLVEFTPYLGAEESE